MNRRWGFDLVGSVIIGALVLPIDGAPAETFDVESAGFWVDIAGVDEMRASGVAEECRSYNGTRDEGGFQGEKCFNGERTDSLENE